jgi:hypothetical protein
VLDLVDAELVVFIDALLLPGDGDLSAAVKTSASSRFKDPSF